MRPALRVIGVSKRYGEVHALRAASLSVESGELVAVLGPSGSGKSTLFRCITRLTEPDGGEIHVADEPLHALSGRRLAEARRDIGVVFQQFNLIRRRTALQNVLAGRLGRVPLWRVVTGAFSCDDVSRATRALEAVGLLDQLHQRADTLSGGQQQRVAIARALAQESRVLLADEPVASLDPDTAVSVLRLMQALTRSNGLAILCTLHQPELAERFADRILRMRDGRLEEETSRALVTARREAG
jgi:phosphonate transport system ATP-binding protein